jgi:putative transcriptional regulator
MEIEAGVKNRVKELRKKRGWTQSEFGEKLGISRQSVHSIEAGKYDPSLPLAFRIADVLGISLDKIFEKHRAS